MSPLDATAILIAAGLALILLGRLLHRRIAPLSTCVVGFGVLLLGVAALGMGVEFLVWVVRNWP